MSAKLEVFDLRGNPMDEGVNRDVLAQGNTSTLIGDLVTFEAGASSSRKPLYSELLKAATELQTMLEAAGFKCNADCKKNYQVLRALAEKLLAK